MMVRTLFLCLGLLAATLASSAAPAQTIVDTSHTVTFGDSLTDNDEIYLYFASNPAAYDRDPMEAFFAKASSPGHALTNFAVLGSESSDVLLQVQYYSSLRRQQLLPAGTLFSLQGGGNDLLDIPNQSYNLFVLANAAPGESEEADAIVDGIRRNLTRSLRILKRDGAPVVLWTIPDITLTPYVLSLGFNAQQTANLRAHILRANRYLRAIGRAEGTILLDLNQQQFYYTFNPPVIEGTVIQPTPAFGLLTDQFADPIHPTGVMNALLANELIDIVNTQFGRDIPLYSEEELGDIAGL